MECQQMQAMGLRLVGRYACKGDQDGCPPRSQFHSFREKESDTCTLQKKGNSLLGILILNTV